MLVGVNVGDESILRLGFGGGDGDLPFSKSVGLRHRGEWFFGSEPMLSFMAAAKMSFLGVTIVSDSLLGIVGTWLFLLNLRFSGRSGIVSAV